MFQKLARGLLKGPPFGGFGENQYILVFEGDCTRAQFEKPPSQMRSLSVVDLVSKQIPRYDTDSELLVI